MRLTTDAGTPWWAKRRTHGVALAVAMIVAGGAVAHASPHGDGFLNPPATNAANGAFQVLTPGVGTGQWQWGTNGYTWNGNTWAWGGTGVNRFAFRALVNRTDPTFNQILGINDRGVGVGYFGSGANAKHPNKGFRFTIRNGVAFFLPENFPGSVQTQAVAINNRGISVGFFVDAKGANHGYVRMADGFRRVDFPGATSTPKVTQLLGINRQGIAVGFFNDARNNSHGFLYNVRTRQFAQIKLPVAATSVVATGINDRGQVVGFYVQGKKTFGFIWAPGEFTVLNLGGHTNTQALGINNLGMVVGSFVDARGKTHGFVRIRASLVRIVDVPGATSTVVNGLNNQGQIVGFFTDRTKRTLGFLAHR